MTDTTDTREPAEAGASQDAARAKRTRSGLTAMNVADLKGLAGQLGITGTTKMRKDDLVAAISAHQSSGPAAGSSGSSASTSSDSGSGSGSSRPSGSGRVSRRAESAVTAPSGDAPTASGRGDGASTSTGAAAPTSSDAAAPTTSDVSDGSASRPARSESGDRSPDGTDRGRTTDQDEFLRFGDVVAERVAQGRADTRAETPAEGRTDTRNETRTDDRPERTDRSDRSDRSDRTASSGQGGQGGPSGQGGQPPQDRSERPSRQAGQADRRSGGQPTSSAGGAGGQHPTQNATSRTGAVSARAGQGSGQSGTGQATGGHQGGQGGQGGQPTRTAAAADQSGPSGPSGQSGLAGQHDDEDDGTLGGRRRNRQRSRDRKRRSTAAGGQDYEPELQIADDDVLVPVAGILDVLDNYAFVRTSGYLAGPSDVYVPLGLVKKNGLRKGDAVTGAVKALREGEQPQQSGSGRQKFNALVRLDTINGKNPEESRTRPDFGKLTPLYPQDRLRLETESAGWTTRVIDLVAPIGKGQRGLVVAPAQAGKTMVVQAIANAITANNPECHLMVVLVDERPEEVTDMQRAVKGEVIASTFDRPADDHTTVAELAIERAKRLVELGHDVVVLLDSITKLGRAYNLSAPASGRILSGGVDSAALYPPKKFFGAARNIENGGSLTIIATALVDTGSRMDEVIFEEFKGTGNMELTLSRDLASRRIFPAVDVNASGTRREELLLGGEEQKIIWKLRRVLGSLEPQQAIELLLERLRKTRSNIEFLRQVQATSSNKLGDDA